MRKFLFISICILAFAPVFVSAQGICTPNYNQPSLCNAIPFFGGRAVNDLPTFLAASFAWLATVIATLLMVMLIYSGAKMILSQGDPAAVKEAKTSLTYSILGFLVVAFGYVIVSMVQFFVKVRSGNPESTRSFFFNPLQDTNLVDFMSGVILSVVTIMGVGAMLLLVWNGFLYVTAGDNEEQTKKAKQGVTWSIVGLISILLSYTIAQVVIQTLNRST